jgi:HK97 gp10 family phage protein
MSSALLGTRELSEQLDRLSDATRRKALRSAMVKSAKVIKAAADASVPIGDEPHRLYTGTLVPPGYASRHILLKIWISKDKRGATVAVGPSAEAYYVTSFIELGFRNRPPEPWLESAFKAAVPSALLKLKAELAKAMKRAAAKGER